MFSYVSPERRIPADHPLRPIRAMTDEVLRQLSPRLVGLSMDDPVWDVTVFTKNRERLLRGDIAEAFFQRVLARRAGSCGVFD